MEYLLDLLRYVMTLGTLTPEKQQVRLNLLAQYQEGVTVAIENVWVERNAITMTPCILAYSLLTFAR